MRRSSARPICLFALLKTELGIGHCFDLEAAGTNLVGDIGIDTGVGEGHRIARLIRRRIFRRGGKIVRFFAG